MSNATVLAISSLDIGHWTLGFHWDLGFEHWSFSRRDLNIGHYEYGFPAPATLQSGTMPSVESKPFTLNDLRAARTSGKKVPVLTCYDYSMARLMHRSEEHTSELQSLRHLV